MPGEVKYLGIGAEPRCSGAALAFVAKAEAAMTGEEFLAAPWLPCLHLPPPHPLPSMHARVQRFLVMRRPPLLVAGWLRRRR